jgi:hypothetical protein
MRMNEMTAAEGSKEESTDAQDFVEGFVEMGRVSDETKGGVIGMVWDGGVGKYTGG